MEKRYLICQVLCDEKSVFNLIPISSYYLTRELAEKEIHTYKNYETKTELTILEVFI